MSPWILIRSARLSAGLTQAALAERAGTTQTAIARLERPGANPRLATLRKVLTASGHQLEMRAEPRLPEQDETLIARHMRMTPEQRATHHDAAYGEVAGLVRNARRADG
jgi:transcriptional regulator with XRE-family HTH domain